MDVNARYNLKVPQANVEDFEPKNDGYEKQLVSDASRIKVGVTDGKSGSSSSKGVTEYTKGPGEISG